MIRSQDEAIALFVFGSALSDAREAKDVDLLIVYRSSDAPHRLRRRIEALNLPPTHVTFMTPTEESFYDFVSTTGARPLTEVEPEEP